MSAIGRLVKDKILSELRKLEQSDPAWKALVVDQDALEVINVACRVQDIMEAKITLVENLTLRRQPLQMPAVYFVAPKKESFEMIINDFKGNQKLYTHCHILCASTTPNRLINELKRAGMESYIKSIIDLNIHFLAIESQAFTLGHPRDMALLYGRDTNEQQKDAYLNRVADQLFTFFNVIGENPTIRYHKSRTGVPNKLASKLQDKLDDYGDRLHNEHTKGDCTLLILDRSVDHLSPVLHEFTYQAMAYDLLPIENNIFGFTYEDGKGQEKERKAILDENDRTFVDLRHRHIVDANKKIAEEFRSFRESSQGITSITKDKNVKTKQLSSAIRAMPAYLSKKNELSLHVQLGSRLMDIFRADNLAAIATMEQNMAMGEEADGTRIKDDKILTAITPILRNPNVDVNVKLRLVIIFIVTQGGMKDERREKLMSLSGFSIEEQNLIRNLLHIGVNLNKNDSLKKKISNLFSRFGSSSQRDDVPYSLSRYVPQVKIVLEEALKGSLDRGIFPYVYEPANPRASVNVSASPSTNSPLLNASAGAPPSRSLRNKTTEAGWTAAKNKGKATDIASPSASSSSAAPAVELSGGRLVIFILGGATFSEIRSAYEVTKELKREVIIGSTSVISPNAFLSRVATLSRADTIDDDSDG